MCKVCLVARRRSRRSPSRVDGASNLAAFEAQFAGADVACVVLGYPDFFGRVGDLRALIDYAHAKGALVVTVTMEPYALALVESPGALGADIAVGEGQALGLPPQNGGPGCGLFACRDGRDFMQQVPGRLCGETVDKNGERGYVLTLSTREQHIRRERATSNICTNHALCALAITIRACLLGKQGFVTVAKQCLAKSEYLKAKLVASGAWELPYAAPTFNEFVVLRKAGPVRDVLAKLAKGRHPRRGRPRSVERGVGERSARLRHRASLEGGPRPPGRRARLIRRLLSTWLDCGRRGSTAVDVARLRSTRQRKHRPASASTGRAGQPGGTCPSRKANMSRQNARAFGRQMSAWNAWISLG